jgi:alpha-N-acetylglucosamine transferase
MTSEEIVRYYVRMRFKWSFVFFLGGLSVKYGLQTFVFFYNHYEFNEAL